jgi:DNA-cytosine methyltransferase
MNVLSLFDGISCARVALDRAGLPVKTYFACEIDKNAIAISQKNYPDIVRLGDVREVKGTSLPGEVDLLIGGSPCTDLSIAKKDRKGLAGTHSSLFWEYVRILREVKPRWFVLENVASMPKADKEVITRELGVEPVMFDASLVSAQSRKRLFWTNLRFDLPADRGIVLKDILQPETEVDPSMVTKDGKAFCVTATYWNGGEGKWEYENNKAHKQRTMVMTVLPKPKEHDFVQVGYFGDKNASGVGGQALRVYTADGKSTTSGVGLYLVQDIGRRLDENGTRHDGDANYPIVRRLEVRSGDKSKTLTGVTKDNLILRDGAIRKLTPIECERLQGLPDKYTEGVAKTHRYKCLGNAFNVDVVAHILKNCL